jgi:tetratricopeptide (TPR) repeat protein
MLLRIAFFWPAIALAALVFTVPAIAAEGDGRADLDKATETKLAASSVDDLNEVIRLAESALKKGLDATNTQFAKRLLASAYLQRGKERARHASQGLSADDFRQLRQAIITDLERALEYEPRQPQAYIMLARLNLQREGGGVKKALALLDKAVELGGDDPAAKATALVLRSSLQEQPDKKRADLDEAVQLTPDDAATVRARGLALADMDKLDLALADLSRAAELDPENESIYEEKAIVLARLKKYDEAIAALDKAHQLNPQSLDPLVVRAGVHQEKGDKQKALADLDEALKLKPDTPWIIRTRSLFLAQNDRLDEAIGELEKLTKRDPKDGATLLQLALFYGAKKNSPKAIEAYRQILRQSPNNWRALRGLGDALLNVGQHAEAIEVYEKAVKLQPKDDSILNNLAWVLCTSPDDKLRNGRRAVELAAKACKASDYKVPHILSTLAAAYAETGDFDNAIKWLTKGLEIAEKAKATDKEGDAETKEALKKELINYKAKKPTRELLSEGKTEEKKTEKKPEEKK